MASENPKLGEKIKDLYGANSLQLSPACWLVSDKGVTTQEVCNKLSITAPTGPGLMGHVVVVRIENYFGFGPTHVWEWLKAKGLTD